MKVTIVWIVGINFLIYMNSDTNASYTDKEEVAFGIEVGKFPCKKDDNHHPDKKDTPIEDENSKKSDEVAEKQESSQETNDVSSSTNQVVQQETDKTKESESNEVTAATNETTTQDESSTDEVTNTIQPPEAKQETEVEDIENQDGGKIEETKASEQGINSNTNHADKDKDKDKDKDNDCGNKDDDDQHHKNDMKKEDEVKSITEETPKRNESLDEENKLQSDILGKDVMDPSIDRAAITSLEEQRVHEQKESISKGIYPIGY